MYTSVQILYFLWVFLIHTTEHKQQLSDNTEQISKVPQLPTLTLALLLQSLTGVAEDLDIY